MRLVFVVLFFISFFAQAQLVVNNSQVNLHGETYFNPKFLKVNQIEKITGKISIKRELQPITDIGTIVQFTFDRKGNLIEKLQTFRVNYQKRDTSSILFHYNDINQLISVTNAQSNGFDAVIYAYDSAGKMSKKQFYRGTNLSQYKYQLNPGKRFFVREETFQHQPQSNQFEITTTFNNQNAPYLSTETEFDALGNVVKKISRYVVTNKKHEVFFTYDEAGKIIQIIENQNLINNIEIKFQFTYDELGNVYEELKYKNGALVQRRQFLFEEVSGLLTAELIKNELNNEITIIQFEYEFFDSVTKIDP